jgi:UDP-2,4-diacetamido-2,4,6-trideoxy-beta-L-altropyranose hydrolase
MNPEICLIVDSNIEKGSGHLSRCVALANALVKRNKDSSIKILKVYDQESISSPKFDYQSIFEFKVQIKDLENILRSQTYQTYIIDLPDESMFKIQHWLPKKSKTILVVDRPDERINAGIVVVPNLVSKSNIKKYRKIIHAEHLYIGPEWMPLRNEFYNYKPFDIRNNLEKVGAYFGSVDKENQMLKVFETSGVNIFRKIIFEVIGNSDKFISEGNFFIEKKKLNYTDYLFNCDLFVGSLGVSAWERSFMGVPSLVTFQGPDQVDDYEEILRLNSAIGLGSAEELTRDMLCEKLEELVINFKRREELSIQSRKIMENHVRKSSEFVAQITNA